jgi:hypothetical protein
MDTVSVPNDAFTQKIKRLLGEKNVLNVGAILKLKIMDAKRHCSLKEFYKKLIEDISTGKTSKLLENSIVNI